MIELELYRQRIGAFRSKLTSKRYQEVKLSHHVSRQQRAGVKTLYILSTLGLCLGELAFLHEAAGWPECPKTPCNKVICFVRSICEHYLHGELKGNMFGNVIKTFRFRNYFYLFIILTKEQKYQIHTSNTSYTPEPVDMRLLVERHGTIEYLLGNGGQHIYNGNPHNGRKDSDTSIPKNKDIKKLHVEMFLNLGRYLTPSKTIEWEEFIFALEITKLSEASRREIKTMYDVCAKLENTGEIKHGEYDKLKEVFSIIGNQKYCDIVDEYLSKMRKVEKHVHHTQQGEETDSADDATLTEKSPDVHRELKAIKDELGNLKEEVEKSPDVHRELKAIKDELGNLKEEVEKSPDVHRELKAIKDELGSLKEEVEKSPDVHRELKAIKDELGSLKEEVEKSPDVHRELKAIKDELGSLKEEVGKLYHLFRDWIATKAEETIGITLRNGDIQSEDAEAIACIVDNSLNLAASGSVAISLLSAGGTSLQNECRERFPSGIKYGDVIMLNGGNLKCKWVFITSWDDCEVEEEHNLKKIEVLKNTLSAILDNAIRKKVKSIAIPAIGMGKMGLSAETVARIILDGVKKRSLRNVRLILHYNSVFKEFQSQLIRMQGSRIMIGKLDVVENNQA